MCIQTRKDGSTIYHDIADHRIIVVNDLARIRVGERLRNSQVVLSVPP